MEEDEEEEEEEEVVTRSSRDEEFGADHLQLGGCCAHLLPLPDRTFCNLRANTRTVNKFYVNGKRQMTDYKAPKWCKVRSGMHLTYS